MFSAAIKSAGLEIAHAFRDDKAGGGVAIIYKNDMPMKKGAASTSEYITFEYCTTIFRQGNGVKLLIVCLYRKQEQAFSNFIDELEHFLDKVVMSSDTIIVTGDFNVWVDLTNNRQAKKLLNLMHGYGLFQHVTVPTHNAGHTLDHVYTNPMLTPIKLRVLDENYGISPDHIPIIIDISCCIDNQQSAQVLKFRNLKNIDMDAFKTDIQTILDNAIFDDGRSFCEDYSNLKLIMQN